MSFFADSICIALGSYSARHPGSLDKSFSVIFFVIVIRGRLPDNFPKKSHHHKFDIDTPGKDSFRLRESGAYQTLIFNDNRSALITENVKDAFNVDEVITQISSDADIVLIEGLKNMSYPKIEVHRKEISKEILFKKDSTIIAFISDLLIDIKIPSFDINDINSIVNFIVEYKNSFGGDDPFDYLDNL